MNDAFGDGLIYYGHREGKKSLRFFDVVRVDSVVEILDCGVHARAKSSVLEVLLACDNHALLCGFNVGHF